MTPAEQAAERSSQTAVAIEALTQPDAPVGTDEQRVQVMRRRRARRHLAAMAGLERLATPQLPEPSAPPPSSEPAP